MKDILQDIMANKRIEVERQKQAVRLQTLLGLGGERLERPTRSMRAALAASSSGIIAEFKRKSPSKGWLHPDAAVTDVLPAYEKGGASACSVLTDSNFFGGSLGDLCKARSAVDLPLLRKDFIIDEYQIYEAQANGAAAVLLICAILDDATLRCFFQLADSLGLSALVEAHDAEEVRRALACGARIIGVNNRNLKDFTVSLDTSCNLRPLVPPSVLFVAESGIKTAAHTKVLRQHGVDAVLIGETLMRAADKKAMLQELAGEVHDAG